MSGVALPCPVGELQAPAAHFTLKEDDATQVERGAAGLDVGDQARVTLVHTDVEQGFIDFARN